MKISVRGKTESMCRAEVKFAAIFFARYLMSDRLLENIQIDLVFENQGKTAQGHCHPTDDERKPRMFEIGINPTLRRHKMLECLAHEMVHLKQYARGELRHELITARWQGKTYKLTNSFEDYLNWPWEIEAYGRDRALYLFYACTLKNEKISFKNGHLLIRGKRATKKMLTSIKNAANI